MKVRAYYKPAGTNPEINGSYYELITNVAIFGHYNLDLDAVNLNFKLGEDADKTVLKPLDPTKPIVLAVKNSAQIAIVRGDWHLTAGALGGMQDFPVVKTDAYIIDCHICRSGDSSDATYWSIKTEGKKFVYGDADFKDTWKLEDCNYLCRFIAGEMTANQLLNHAYFIAKKAAKEEKRQNEIAHLKRELEKTKSDLEAVNFLMDRLVESAHTTRTEANIIADRYGKLIEALETAMNGFWPFISKNKLLKFISDTK